MASNQKSAAVDTQLFIPRASVRRIMKLNDEVTIIAADAVVATAKASELFIADILESARKEASSNGRKTIKVDDFIRCIENNQSKYEFLNECVNLRKSSS